MTEAMMMSERRTTIKQISPKINVIEFLLYYGITLTDFTGFDLK